MYMYTLVIGWSRHSSSLLWFLNQTPDMEPGDVIVVLSQKAHDVFKREGMDLKYVVSKRRVMTEDLY